MLLSRNQEAESLPSTRKLWTYWSKSSEGHKGDEGPEHPSHKERLRGGTLQPGEQKAWGRSYQCIEIPDGKK